MDHGMQLEGMAAASLAVSGGALGADASLWFRVLGRMHPLLVHFPLGLVLSAAAVESVRWARRDFGISEFTRMAMALAAIGAVAAASTGWLNAWQEGADASWTLTLHRWLGTAMAAALLPTAWVANRRSVSPAVEAMWAHRGRVATLACAVGVAAVGHFGGELVYGEGYVERALWAAMGARDGGREPDDEQTDGNAGEAPEAPEAVAAAGAGSSRVHGASATTDGAIAEEAAPGSVDFRSQILPIFETHCYECHGRGKKKGGLAMGSSASMTKVTDEGAAVVPGKPDESLIVQRINLPADDLDAMPPEGERLSQTDRDLIRTWVSEGGRMPSGAAATSDSAAAGAVPSDVASIRVSEPALTALRARGVVVQAVAQGDPRLEVNASVAQPPISDADLRLLAPIADAVVQLNLSRTAVTDEGLAHLKGFDRLEQLRIDSTPIGDRALACVASMPRLEVLNIHSTKVTDDGLGGLSSARALKRVFAWNSGVTRAGADALTAAHPGVVVNLGAD